MVVVFFGSLVSISGRPLIGLLVYLYTFYMYAPGSWWGNGLPSLRWSLLAALVTLIGIFVAEKKLDDTEQAKFFSVPEFKLFTAFVIWVWVQNIWSISPAYHSEYSMMATKLLLLLYLMHRTLKDEKSIVAFIVANIVGCAYFGWIGWTQHHSGRFESVPTPGLADGNLLSLHMVPILLLASFLLLCDYKKIKFLLVVPLALTLNAIFLTQSRGAIVGLIIAGALALLFRPKKLRSQIYVYMILIAVAGVKLIPEDLVSRLNKAAGPEEERDKSAESRLVIIEAQFNMFIASPILGYGHRGTLALSPDFIDSAYLTNSHGTPVRGSHNLLMSLLVDFGLVGSIFYLLIIFIFIRRLFQLRTRIIDSNKDNLLIIYMAGTCALVALMVSSMFSNSLRLEIDILIIGLLSVTYQRIQIKIKNEKRKQCAV